MQPSLDENKCLNLWNATVICEMFTTSWYMEKHLSEKRFRKPLSGPVIPFGAMNGISSEFFDRPIKTPTILHENSWDTC